VETRTGRRVIEVSAVEWIRASGNYARLHLPGESVLYRMPLSQLENELDPGHFLRVHRSAMVNLSAVVRVLPLPSGDVELILSSGTTVRMSRRYARAFHDATGRAH
jgi:two-component system, LytTR family, response regulator